MLAVAERSAPRRLIISTIRTALGLRVELSCGHALLLGHQSSAGMRRQSRVECPQCLEEHREDEETDKLTSRKPRYCSRCGCKLRRGNRSTMCAPCQDKEQQDA